MVAIPWSLLIEQAGTAVLIIGYLMYELRWGRGASLDRQMDGVIHVVIAIARENPDIDEDAVADRLNEVVPADYQIVDHEQNPE